MTDSQFHEHRLPMIRNFRFAVFTCQNKDIYVHNFRCQLENLMTYNTYAINVPNCYIIFIQGKER